MIFPRMPYFHTHGEQIHEEVTFGDLVDRVAKNKIGYNKIRFCGEQAKRDGLAYFWVDTCCIDKSNNNELSEAINSMFRWYRNAVKCYVYLRDVSKFAADANDSSSQVPWEMDFRKSKWFTRGWTLQELIAPNTVEFYSNDCIRLGDKNSLEQLIQGKTGIPLKALRGSPLSDFSVTERMSWIKTRETTRKEDLAYSLLGIFDVYMPPIYGEGRENAFKRLREEITKAAKGARHANFSVVFSLFDIPEIEHFVAREDELAEMNRALSGDGSRRAVVVHGLGGMGKTQLTVAYDEDSLKQSFAKIAKQILREHPQASGLRSVDMNGTLNKVVDAVKAWMSLPDNTRWLMVYDNYDNPKLPGNADPAAVDIRKFLPESYHGAVIITTRSSQVKIGHHLRIRKLEDIRDSLKILFNASRREGLMDDPDAVSLAQELDGLPLALATAGAYLDQSAMSFSDYLRLYKASWAKLQETSPELSSYEDRTLYSTWQLSYERVKQQNECSANLLRLWAYFNNQDVWFELLQHIDSDSPEWFRELTKDDLNFHAAVRVLCNHGLAEVDTSVQKTVESRGYSIHGCVHSWTTYILNQQRDYDLPRLDMGCVGSHVQDDGDAEHYSINRRLLPHVNRCAYFASRDVVVAEGMEWAFSNLGRLYANLSKLDDSVKMYKWLLKGREEVLGFDDIFTLKTVNNLGLIYKDQGKLDDAEKMHHRALRGMENALGLDHVLTLMAVINLGGLYAAQGKLDNADKMYQRGLRGMEKVLGLDHVSTLYTVHNLGNLYTNQGRLDDAEKMYQRALRGKEKALGLDHVSTLNTVSNLGNLYVEQGKLGKAKTMIESALRGFEKALGEENFMTHVPALDTTVNLGHLFKRQGNLAEASIMFIKALDGYNKIYGPEHLGTQEVQAQLLALGNPIKRDLEAHDDKA